MYESAQEVRAKSAIEQLFRYGLGPVDGMIDALEALASVNDDVQHGRTEACIQESAWKVFDAIEPYLRTGKDEPDATPKTVRDVPVQE